MFSTDDTIVAISTPIGRAGLGIVRLSGPRAAEIAQALVRRGEKFLPRHATLAQLTADGINDQVVVTVFPAPQSYTGDDVAEISAHGSPVVLHGILQSSIAAGARLAEPGEFTLRAFLNGKLDLVQAEAVADLIEAVTPLQARAAFDQLEGTLTEAIAQIESRLFDLMARLEASLDFPDEGYHFVERSGAAAELDAIGKQIETLLARAARGRLIREGAQIAILGTPNVGKSSLFNALLNADRAIVTPIAGTTRDLLTERADLRGLAVGLVDTAGIRKSDDVIEREGVVRARQAADVADLTIVVLDRSRGLTDEDRALVGSAIAGPPHVIVANKTDLPEAWTPESSWDAVAVSAKTGDGLPKLIDTLASRLGAAPERRDQPLVTNVRHAALLDRARIAIGRAGEALSDASSTSEEFVLADLQEASTHLQEITGRRTTEDLLRHIFERFCIGK
jgi:tRNA modification GTPase